MAFCIFRFFRLVIYPECTSLLFSYIELFVLSFISTWRELLVKVVRVFFLRIGKNFLHKHQFARAMRY